MKITSNITDVIRQLEQYRNTLEDKKKLLMEELAQIGVETARFYYSDSIYDGEGEVTVDPYDWVDDNTLAIRARGKAILFIEFGTGAWNTIEHPQAAEFGYGPGTFSDNEALGGKGHWDDPNGWYYEHGHKSWGNEPALAMYLASKDMRETIMEKAREVFGE